MLLDKKGRLFGKINVLDLLVILFMIVVLGILVFHFLNSQSRATSKPMEVTVYIDDVQPDVAHKIKDVKEVYFGRGLVKTNVSNVEILPMPTGSRRPDFKEVRIILSGTGYINGDGAYFDNQRVALGNKIWLRSIYELETTVMQIK